MHDPERYAGMWKRSVVSVTCFDEDYARRERPVVIGSVGRRLERARRRAAPMGVALRGVLGRQAIVLVGIDIVRPR
jgi:hypothetical protein